MFCVYDIAQKSAYEFDDAEVRTWVEQQQKGTQFLEMRTEANLKIKEQLKRLGIRFGADRIDPFAETSVHQESSF